MSFQFYSAFQLFLVAELYLSKYIVNKITGDVSCIFSPLSFSVMGGLFQAIFSKELCGGKIRVLLAVQFLDGTRTVGIPIAFFTGPTNSSQGYCAGLKKASAQMKFLNKNKANVPSYYTIRQLFCAVWTINFSIFLSPELKVNGTLYSGEFTR